MHSAYTLTNVYRRYNNPVEMVWSRPINSSCYVTNLQNGPYTSNFHYCITQKRYGDSAGNTTEKKSSVFSQIGAY